MVPNATKSNHAASPASIKPTNTGLEERFLVLKLDVRDLWQGWLPL